MEDALGPDYGNAQPDQVSLISATAGLPGSLNGVMSAITCDILQNPLSLRTQMPPGGCSSYTRVSLSWFVKKYMYRKGQH